MKKCPFCAEEIREEAIKCRYCGEFLTGGAAPKPGEKWYWKGHMLFVAFFCVGPFMLPLVWAHPRYPLRTKALMTVAALLVTYLLFSWSIQALRSVSELYREMGLPGMGI